MTETDRNLRRKMLDAFKVRFHDNEKTECYNDRLMAALEEVIAVRDAAQASAVANLIDALAKVIVAIETDDSGVITDTLWMPDDIIKGCTVVDFLQLAIDTNGAVAIDQKPAGYVNAESFDRMVRGHVSGISIQRELKEVWYDKPLYETPQPDTHRNDVIDECIKAVDDAGGDNAGYHMNAILELKGRTNG